MKTFNEKINEYIKIIDKSLDDFLEVRYPQSIWESMRYSVLAEGKRIRPIMTLEIAKVISGNFEDALATACAVEMLHAQSLIHDDLPCMDNDDYRRGKLTNHKVFGESTAVLAGDALLSFAPQIIIEKTPESVTTQIKLNVLNEFFHAAGAYGLIAGQIVDIKSEKQEIDNATLTFIHTHKTSMLFRLALRSGAMIVGASEAQLVAVSEFADNIGLAFQICDDILDETATFEDLGKTPKKDIKTQKATYVRMYGLSESRQKVHSLCKKSYDILNENHLGSEILFGLVENIEKRIN